MKAIREGLSFNINGNVGVLTKEKGFALNGATIITPPAAAKTAAGDFKGQSIWRTCRANRGT